MTTLLDLDLLNTLLSIERERSFTKAGERLGLTQQAVSAQVKRIETAIRRQVITRGGARVQLTPDGEALIAYAKHALEIAARIDRHFSAIKVDGRIRLGVLDGFATAGLPIFLSALRRDQPDLEVLVETGFTERLVLRQDNGELDIVFGAQRRGTARGDKLWDDHLQWFGDASVYADPFVPVRLALPPEHSLVRAAAIEALAAAGRPFSVVFQSESRASLRAAALAGIGLTVCCAFDEDRVPSSDHVPLPEITGIEYFIRADERTDLVREAAHLLRDAAFAILRDSAAEAPMTLA